MLFKQISVGRCPYGTIFTGDLLGGVTRGDPETNVLVEELLTFPPRKPVFLAGDRPSKIFIHRFGRVLLYGDAGEIQLLDACSTGPHRIFGIIETLSGESFGRSMRTITRCDFGAIEVADFLDYVRKNPNVCFNLAKVLSRLFQVELNAIKSH